MHDRLKSITRGYGKMDYEVIGFRPAELVKVDILVKGTVDALATIMHRDQSRAARAGFCASGSRKRLRRPSFEIPIQAAIGHPHHRRETIARHAQERDGQVLRARHHPQTEVVGEAKKKAERLKTVRAGRIPQKAFSRSSKSRRLVAPVERHALAAEAQPSAKFPAGQPSHWRSAQRN